MDNKTPFHSTQRTDRPELKREMWFDTLLKAASQAASNTVHSDYTDRLFTLLEEETKRAHELEKGRMESRAAQIRLGQIFGLIIGVITIITGAVTIMLGATLPGSIIGTGGVIGLVSVFVLGRR